MEKYGFRLNVKSYPLGVRFLLVAGVMLLCFLVVSVIMIFVPRAQVALLRVVLPILLFLLGALWTFAQLPWYLGWVVPSGLFILFAFLRLEGVYSLNLLLGYVPLALAGSLSMNCLVIYLKRSNRLTYTE